MENLGVKKGSPLADLRVKVLFMKFKNMLFISAFFLLTSYSFAESNNLTSKKARVDLYKGEIYCDFEKVLNWKKDFYAFCISENVEGLEVFMADKKSTKTLINFQNRLIKNGIRPIKIVKNEDINIVRKLEGCRLDSSCVLIREVKSL